MPARDYKPTTPARRGMSAPDNSQITTNKPYKPLTQKKSRIHGRNNQGHITVRRRGGGAKRLLRLVNFQLAPGTSATVKTVEYDPNRSAHIALLETSEGTKHYVLAGKNTRVGDVITAGEEAPVKPGNRLPLRQIPIGRAIYNVELNRGQGGQLARGAGTRARIAAKEGDSAHVKLPSGEVRLIDLDCYATLGSVSNEQHQNVKIGSAGRNRRLGKRPHVRGKAMNPADHPMGGGEGLSGPGRLPQTPWGKKAIGKKTRRRKQSDKKIVRNRKQSKRG